jgi:hypothetical protein
MAAAEFLNGPHDSDVALIGTGVAPLIAASHLIAQGKRVLVLNPDFDFFLEDSELPLDPMLPLGASVLKPESLSRQNADYVLNELRPLFPGAVEQWSPGGQPSTGFHDLQAPHVRSRSRLWIQSELGSSAEWPLLEEAYVHASDSGMNPKILEGLQAVKKFPGFSSGAEAYRGLLLPKFCDVDVSRYRNGVLEFVRERLGADRFILSANHIEPMPGGLRFYSGGRANTARLAEEALVFWTPRMSSWVLNQSKRAEVTPPMPRGTRLWEQWSLVSREALDPEVIGTFSNMVVWAEAEGDPTSAGRVDRLSVLRGGPLVSEAPMGTSWITSESLNSLSVLCYDFLKWNRFSIRSMKPRAIFEWSEGAKPWTIRSQELALKIVPACDGPLVNVVRASREATA